MNYTTIEQSKKLVKLGLNPDTADMIYYDYKFTGALSVFNGKAECTEYKNCTGDIHVIPCWSLGALFQVIPTKIGKNLDYWLTMETTTACNYVLFYKNIYSNEEVCESSKNENLLDSAIDLIEKLIKEGFLNTKG